MNTLRQLLAYVVVAIFLVFFFLSGLAYNGVSVSDLFATKDPLPDFSQYNELRTLSKEEYPIDSRNKRVIIVGDIHGSSGPLHTLLNKLTYDSHSDVLIHVGDVAAKGTHEGSLSVLEYLAANNVTGVRGNHDQKIVEWRAWMDWIRGLEGGAQWLAEVDEQAGMLANDISEEWVEEELTNQARSGKWRKKIPKGWKMFSDHYRIARDMSQKQYEYLLSLPIVLHVPSAHTYIVHAGLLPHDPTRDQMHWRQPLSHVPSLPLVPSILQSKPRKDVERLRLLQEQALLYDIPQNTDPWVKMNIRSVKNNKVTKSSKKGTPWSEIWNAAMESCDGFGIDGADADLARKKKGKKSLPCRPSTVVYGHAASRGVDVKRWSIGTDSGCVYRRRLSALVLGSPSSHLTSGEVDKYDDLDLQSILYGDDGRGQIVSIKCH